MTSPGKAEDCCIACKRNMKYSYRDDPSAPAEFLYILSTCGCLVCKQCLLNSWLTTAPGSPIPCPFTSCHKPTIFRTLDPTDIDYLDSFRNEMARWVMDNKREVMYSLMGVETQHARMYLDQLCRVLARQPLTPAALGYPRSPDASIGKPANPFFEALQKHFPYPSKRLLITPIDLQITLHNDVDTALWHFSLDNYGKELARLGADFQDTSLDAKKTALDLVVGEIPDIQDLQKKWYSIADLVVGHLAIINDDMFYDFGKKSAEPLVVL
ncbi:hypothetical protein K504DRAFT_456166 [Pleomassaria siparia CBS 279.74]|uniref:Uncharacterized protein n=1 Tax=Pleomassaria siparia CBS 279.74 TaxID=1314801 RepID=A0A6G1K6N8_9PLEO|nr:hypothetical protein K504DRAFT_456166 [Pleomassaria siparia CBS 279.74]